MNATRRREIRPGFPCRCELPLSLRPPSRNPRAGGIGERVVVIPGSERRERDPESRRPRYLRHRNVIAGSDRRERDPKSPRPRYLRKVTCASVPLAPGSRVEPGMTATATDSVPESPCHCPSLRTATAASVSRNPPDRGTGSTRHARQSLSRGDPGSSPG
jgi:hypothetical protein